MSLYVAGILRRRHSSAIAMAYVFAPLWEVPRDTLNFTWFTPRKS